jgi:hypothetical protein
MAIKAAGTAPEQHAGGSILGQNTSLLLLLLLLLLDTV